MFTGGLSFVCLIHWRMQYIPLNADVHRPLQAFNPDI